MCRAVVVIPLYQGKLKPSERISLAQAKSVLKRYDLCYMMPERLRDSVSDRDIQKEFWPDRYFASSRTYSKLLLMPEFYQRFEEYEYMLIYQLDAFVFSDKLQDFCDMGYDYIGAPMPYWACGWGKMPTRVGNGGLSLRRVASCYRVTLEKTRICAETGYGAEFEYDEDKFFGYCGGDPEINFTVPKTEVAVKFSIEFDIRGCHGKLSKDNLPFGCHGWSKPHWFDLWHPFINHFVGDMEDVVAEVKAQRGMSCQEMRRSVLYGYLAQRLHRQSNGKTKLRILQKIMPMDRRCILWGNGKIGRRALSSLSLLGLDVAAIVDSNAEDNAKQDDISVVRPDADLLSEKQMFIIIAVIKEAYVLEIVTYLEKLGLRDGDDFLCYKTLNKKMLDFYCALLSIC